MYVSLELFKRGLEFAFKMAIYIIIAAAVLAALSAVLSTTP